MASESRNKDSAITQIESNQTSAVSAVPQNDSDQTPAAPAASQNDSDQASAPPANFLIRVKTRNDIASSLFRHSFLMWAVQQREESETCGYIQKPMERSSLQRLLWQASIREVGAVNITLLRSTRRPVLKFPVAMTPNTAFTMMHDNTRRHKRIEKATTRAYDKA
ncbi:hypothetical protein CJF32_00009164 [Rutstroemia sp. NJR-2017a WRK4]|nr:hypothetical protein CJF32_00009164 [Rutstroemia sp. NJR-2017a WRK4]